MMQIKDIGDQEILKGASVGSIVRRTWGRRASYVLEYDSAFNPSTHTAIVVMPNGEVVGRIFIDKEQDGFRWDTKEAE